MQGDQQWRLFKERFPTKKYTSRADERLHYDRFLESLQYIQDHSAALPSSFKVGLTSFSDALDADIDGLFHEVPDTWRDRALPPLLGGGTMAASQAIDWSTKQNPLGRSVVTSVKDQRQCGACWAFSAAESTESAVAMSTGILESLSAQELIDCDTVWDQGCVGGNPVLAFPYIIRNGLASESKYPYVGVKDTCRADQTQSVSGITGFRVLRSNDEGIMKQWVGRTPVAVGVCGLAKSFLMYTGGVYDDPLCGDTLNHALLIVGYGTTPQGVEYWRAKNSWGLWWGEEGFIRIRRNTEAPEGVCGIAKAPTFAVGGLGGNASDPGLPQARDGFSVFSVPERTWLEVCDPSHLFSSRGPRL